MASYYSSGNSYRKNRSREDVDPMSSMSNVGDIMLVFACGLMVALVMAWNVDLAQFAQVEMDQELEQNDVTEMNEQLYGEGNSFVEMGKVYQDPATGKYYLVEEGDSAGSSDKNSGESSSGSSASSQGSSSKSSNNSSSSNKSTGSTNSKSS